MLTSIAVWFIYPETANVRLEDMNSIFGDATTAAPTPQTLAEAESIFSRSPSSFRLGDDSGVAGPQDSAIPDLEIDPPRVEVSDSGKPMYSKDANDTSEGVGGWISNLVKRGKGEGENGGAGSGKYKRVGQDDDAAA